jgi:hypothetical protein
VISIIDEIEVVTQEFMTTHHKSTTYYSQARYQNEQVQLTNKT